MFYIAVSAYTVETAGWVYGQCGKLDFLIKPGDVPSDWPFGLNTSSIGHLLPALQKLYPNRPMEVEFDGQAKPVVMNISPKGGSADLLFLLKAFVISANNTRIPVFALNVTVAASADVSAFVNHPFVLHQLQNARVCCGCCLSHPIKQTIN